MKTRMITRCIMRHGFGSLLLLCCFASTASSAATRTWGGGDSGALASADLNWVEGAAPISGDDIVLNATTNKSMTWDLDVDVASWTQDADYDGTVTFSTVYGATGFTNFSITGNCVISNGMWTHNANTTTEANRLRVSVGGNMVIGADGSVSAIARGYSAQKGPGGNGINGDGANHAGIGIDNAADPLYGSAVTPTTLGSGGRSGKGGGAIWLTVAGALTNNGAIEANGQAVTYNTGAGGSVYITAGSLVGSGTISANAGIGSAGRGGGGRIAIVLTDVGASFSDFDGTVEAVTLASTAGNGTLYIETEADNGRGELRIDGGGGTGFVGLNELEEETYDFSRIVLTNNAFLRVTSTNTLVWTNTVFAGGSGSALWLYGTTVQTPANFAYSNFSIGIRGAGTVFNPSQSLTLGTNATLYVDVPYAMTTAVVVANGGIMSHSGNGSAETYKLDLTIDGSLTLESGGSIDVEGKGYSVKQGPGGASVNGWGASHGGCGQSNPDALYGSIVAPTNLGSGGYTGKGGGAVRLRVSGAVTNNGTIAADGQTVSYNSGAGGSVYLTAGSIEGTGAVRARGGAVDSTQGGGGGRISLVVTNAGAGFDSFTGAVDAYGANINLSGAGTVYLRTADQSAYEGTLIIDNNSGTGNAETRISSNVTDRAVGDVILRNNGYLVIDENESLTVSGIWSNDAKFAAGENGAIVFTGGVGSTSTIYGATTFCDLVCTNAGKTLLFEAGTIFTVDDLGALTLIGAESADVVLRSTTTTSAWYLNVSNSADRTVSYVDVWDSDASGGAMIVANNSADERTVNWTFASAGATNIWDGSESTVFGEDGNWSLGYAPTQDDVVVIPSGCPRYPTLDSAKSLNQLTIESGASLALGGYDLTVSTNVLMAGTLAAQSTETLTFEANADFTGGTLTSAWSTIVIGGAEDQSIDLDDLTVYALELQNSAGTVTFGGGFVASEFECRADSGTRDLVFGAGETYTVRNFVVLGATGQTNVTFSSTSPGTQWNLEVTGYSHIRGVDATDSDADTGKAIYPFASHDGGQNDNWTFTGNWSSWLGITSTDFHEASNWSPADVPGATSRVAVDSVNPLTISAGVTVQYLQAGGLDNTILTINTNLTVTGDVVLLDGGTLTHAGSQVNGLALAIGGDLVIDVGGALDVEGKGYGNKSGPAPGTLNGQGGSHGGCGRSNDNSLYGSFTAPTNMGSGGYSYPGGGAIRLTVSGAAMVDGIIRADGDVDRAYNSGAGGSILMSAGSLSGIGAIRSNGGSYGGGGRISITVTDGGADFTAFGGSIEAYGLSAGAGTVYLQTADDLAGRGTVYVDNDGNGGNTDVPPASYYTEGEANHASFVVTNGATLRLDDDFSVGDIHLGSGATLNLNSLTLTVDVSEHVLTPGTVSNYGAIVWTPPGSLFLFR